MGKCSHPDITSEEPKTRTADRSSGNQAAPTSHVTPSHSSTRAMAVRLSLCGPIRVQQSTRHSARVRASERENERRLRQVASDAFKRIGSARDEVHAGHHRELIQRTKQAATPSPAERDLRHLQAFSIDGRGGNTDRGQHLTHGFRKARTESVRLSNRHYDRQTRALADEEQDVTVAHSNEVSVPVAELRR